MRKEDKESEEGGNMFSVMLEEERKVTDVFLCET